MSASNPLGALVFWSYILAALFLSAKTIHTIASLPPPGSPIARRNERLFAALALVSFAVLSYNMLHVLFLSYNEWSIHQSPLPQQLLVSFLRRVWLWSWTSTLFFDFGTAIVASPGEYLFTQSALLVTYGVSVDMAAKGMLIMHTTLHPSRGRD
jgi:hypothetical protein